MERGTLKTRIIFIATRGKTACYRTVEEVPPGLRKKLARTTKGANSGTLLIADRRGLQELIRAGIRQRSESKDRKRRRGEVVVRFVAQHWPEMGLSGTLGILLWLALFFR